VQQLDDDVITTLYNLQSILTGNLDNKSILTAISRVGCCKRGWGCVTADTSHGYGAPVSLQSETRSVSHAHAKKIIFFCFISLFFDSNFSLQTKAKSINPIFALFRVKNFFVSLLDASDFFV
jgi:hypothetical protein